MTPVTWIITIVMLGLTSASAADAEEIGGVSTPWHIWADDKIWFCRNFYLRQFEV
jgi:hypothetical protein